MPSYRRIYLFRLLTYISLISHINRLGRYTVCNIFTIIVQTWQPVASRRGTYFEVRQLSALHRTKEHAPSNSALTTATQQLAVSLSTSTSTLFHFVAGRTLTEMTYVQITFTASPVLTATSSSRGVPTLAKVQFSLHYRSLNTACYSNGYCLLLRLLLSQICVISKSPGYNNGPDYAIVCFKNI